MGKLQGVEFRIKFSLMFSDWESKGDLEHTLRYIWKHVEDLQYNIKTKDLTVQSKHGVWSVYLQLNNSGCNCELCNPKKS